MAKIIQIAVRFDEILGLDEKGVLWTLDQEGVNGNPWLCVATSPDEKE